MDNKNFESDVSLQSKRFCNVFFLFFVFGFGTKFENDIIIIITKVNVAQNFSRRIQIPWGYVVE